MNAMRLIKAKAKNDVGLYVGMKDHWLDNGEIWVMLQDVNGSDSSIIISVAKSATLARKRAIAKLQKVIEKLEEMDK